MMSSVTGGCPLALVILLLVSMDPTATEVRTHTKYQLESYLQPVMMSPVTGGCPLALVILLLVSTEPTATAVVKKVSDCAEFFLDGKPPKIENVLDQGNIQYPDRYSPICQKYNNKIGS
ncbi:unnamed protein product [Gadus morhua 'NCC']